MERICNCASHCWRCQGGGAWLPGGGAAFEWYYSAILPDCPLGCDGSFLRHLCFQAKKLARKWEGCRSIGNGIWRSDWRKNTDGSPHQEAKILQCHFTHVNKFLFDCLTTFNTMWLFSRNIVVFVHNILFSTGSIFFSYFMRTWSLYLSFSFSIFLKILSFRNYFLAEGESWILSICVTAILFSLFRLLCILPVSKVIPFFGLRNFLSLFILDWRLKSCAPISLFLSGEFNSLLGGSWWHCSHAAGFHSDTYH